METIKSWIAQGKLSALIEKTNQTGQLVLILQFMEIQYFWENRDGKR